MRCSLVLVVLLAACGGRAPDAGTVDEGPETPPEAPRLRPVEEGPLTEAAPAGEAPAGEAPVEAAPVGADPATFDGTAGVTEVRREGPVARLVEVRTGRHEGFDRIVFEFADRVPGWHVEYVDRPVRACGSGDVVEVAGDGWLQIRLHPAEAHDEQGQATVRDRNRTTSDLGNVRQLVAICDFEGEVVWVAGTASPKPYRVLELAGPPRLVVDVRR